MARLIDADTLPRFGRRGGLVNWYDIVKAPTVDAVPVIRCKDCRHQVKEWRDDKRFKGNGYYACGCDIVGDACGYWALLGQDYDYCSMAERKEVKRDG